MDIQLFQYHLLKRLSFLHWIALNSLVKDQLAILVWVYFSVLSSISLIIDFLSLISIFSH